ncbi:MAG TPA: MFS transporter [Blastocatellia bacterium]|nr:MFS transporter [Blastocatellia bacterium]
MASVKVSESDQSAQAQVLPKAGAVMAILFLIFFLGTSDNQMLSPLLPLIARDFGLESGQVGEMLGPAYALAAAAAALFIGPLSDRYGRRRFLLYASILFGLSLLAAAFVKDARLLAAVRVLTGLAAGTFSTCSIAYVADYFPYERRGVAMSIVQAGYFAALVAGVPIASMLAQWQSWRASFAFFAALAAAAFLLALALLPEDRPEPGASGGEARRLDNIKVVFQGADRIASIAAAFCVSCGFVGFIFYLGSWLTMDFRLTTRGVGLFFIIVGVAALIGALTAGPVADKVGKRVVSLASTLLLAAMLALIPQLGWGVFLIAAFLLASVAFAFRQGPLQALATEMVPPGSRGALVAMRNTASQIGIAVSTAVSGLLYDRSGYAAVGIFCGVVTLAAAACILLMKEPQKEGSGHR